jgi:hypothetical protein
MHDPRCHHVGLSPRVVNDKALVRIDDQVMPQGAHAKIAGELGRRIDMAR